MNIPITRPLFGPEELRAIQRPLETGWVVQGPFVKEFEDKFAAFTGVTFAVATSSCTSALHLAMAALKLEAGDEVIVPAFTWVSTPNVVEYMGARPVFCDIDLRTFNLDARQLEERVTERTVGIVPVHLFGLCADMDPILAVARRRSLWVVEDAACAFGALYRGRHAGGFGEVGCFSFHPRKSITTGEGGMFTTHTESLGRLARSLRDHGASRSDLARHTGSDGFLLPEYRDLGYNYRMTDIQGALGSAQMDRASAVLADRARAAARYETLLAELDWLRTPSVPDGFVHGFQAYVCFFEPELATLASVERLHVKRNALMRALEQRGIATRQGTHAPVLLHYYAEKYGLKPEQFPNAYLADRLSLTLPLYPQITEHEQTLVVRSLDEATGG